ncbi:hypothetical protein MIR68_005888 [Amoeboaphelidium protococcarum]|nr:hypothetical protein MIR68_005888 [Amoeboaphelidium protococcarum]
MPVTAHPEETLKQLIATDAQLKSLPVDKWAKLPSEDVVIKTVKALEEKKYKVVVCDTKEQALEFVKNYVPEGKSVFNVHSTSLEEIGFVEHLKTQTKWNNLHPAVWATSDPAQQAKATKAGHNADFVFGSATAISQKGDITAVDLTGTKVGAFNFAAGHLVLVCGTHKIVPTYEDAIKRTEEFCLPVESARVRIAYKIPGSQINNFVAIRGPNPMSPVNRVTVVFVKEVIGY